ncbi:MAG TPA: SLBB domain-containing protein, partial [Gemmatimonadales bacterium]|nr:SLBB domain-containing protein [Gemmatimonadales bacterium]
IGGEVRFPGTYALRNKNERLLDLIDRAGGVTTQAYTNGIRFHRAGEAGRVGVDLTQLLKHRRGKDNILLAAGDSIVIPGYVPTVQVGGAVNSPGIVTYIEGQGLDYYVNSAGGYSYKADKRRTYVEQPNGNVRTVHKRPLFFGSSKPTPEPGAQVFVPERNMVEQSNTAATLAAIGTIIASLTTIVVVIVNRP